MPVELNPYSYDFHADPYPTYRELRDTAPVYRNDDLDFWALSRFVDVVEASRDHETFSSASGTSLELMNPESAAMRDLLPMIIFMDPPRQTRLRRLVSRVFTPRAVADLEPAIRELCRRFLDPLVERGRCDLVRDFSALLPIEVISTILGIPDADRTAVREWMDAGLHRDPDRPDPPPSAIEAMAESHVYYVGLLADRRRRPADDMLSGLITAEVTGDDGTTERLSDEEILGFLGLLAGAGAETVTKLLGNAAVLLSRHPDQRAALAADPAVIPGAFEEILRYWPPSQFQGRTTLREVTRHGVTIPAGARVLLLTAAATHDEREYDDPDRFDIARVPHVALGFGHGVHACLGAALARLESRVALEEWHRRIPDYQVDEAGLERVHMSNVHGFAGVPMSW